MRWVEWWIILILFALIVTLAATDDCKADTVLVHVASQHIVARDSEHNEFNPGFSMTKDWLNDLYFIAGAYRNSLGKATVLGGVGWRYEVLPDVFAGIDGGVATGYQYAVTPVISPFVRVHAVKLNLIPVVSRSSQVDGVAVGFSLEFNLEE